MTWREDLRTVNFAGKKLVGASFRGVPFFVETVEVSTGRRIVVHEFPLRNDPFVEDLGRRARKFRVDGYLVGNDYLVQKTALVDALELEGPGLLVLPYYPTKRAIGETVSVRESRAEGGFAVVSVEFCETPVQALTPVVTTDPASKVAASAAAAKVASKAELVETFDALGLPGFAVTSAEAALTKASAAVGAQLGQVAGLTQDLAALGGQVSLIALQAVTLARAPADAFDAFDAAVTSLAASAVAAPGAVFDALVAAYSVDMGPAPDVTTATRARELANQQALTGALRRAIAIEAARLAPLVPYVSIEDAIAARGEVAALLEEQAAGAGDTAYPALVTLRSDVLRAVPGSRVFARIVTVNRRIATPSLLLAYQLYGSVDRELDIVARNRIRHPGFIAGDLKVLSNA